MRILVTGSKGLIGSALTIKLKALGAQIVEFDFKEDKDHPDYGNILDGKQVDDKLRGCQGVVHLAAVSRVIFGEKNPELCWKTNVEGTQSIVQSSLNSPQKPWVLYASSREVYGQQEKLPVSESAPLQPVNIYGKSKAAAEETLLQARQKGLKVAILRYSNVYGSVHDHPDRVIPAFCRAAVLGRPLIVEGKDNLFDFTYIEDVVKGTLSMISKLLSDSAPLPPIHLTTGQATSLQQAANLAIQAGKSSSKITSGVPRSYDVATFCGDPSLARELLDWKATVTLEEGIRRFVDQLRLK